MEIRGRLGLSHVSRVTFPGLAISLCTNESTSIFWKNVIIFKQGVQKLHIDCNKFATVNFNIYFHCHQTFNCLHLALIPKLLERIN